MTTLQILQDAKALIATPDRWLQGNFASRDGQRFCAAGAIKKAVCGDPWQIPDERTYQLIRDAYRAMDAGCGAEFSGFNDTHSHAEVLAAFTRAIETERATSTEPRP